MGKNSQSLIEQGITNSNIVVAAYTRVSLARQSKEGYSMDAQLDSIEKYVNDNGWYLPKDFIFREEKPATRIEDDKKGDECSLIDSFPDRPELTKLIDLAQQKRFTHLVIYSRDRLSRVVEDTIALELFFKRQGIKIHYIRAGENFDESNSEIERLLHIVFTSLAEMEGNLLSSRVKDGMMTCVSKGRWAGGRTPLGYIPIIHKNNSEDKKKWHTTLKPSDLESQLIEEVYKLYLSGLGYRKVANKMNKRYGFIKWSKGKIEAIIKNQTYTGQIVWDRRGGRRTPRRRNDNPLFSPQVSQNIIIDSSTWETVVEVRRLRSKSNDAHYYDTNFILKDKLICSKCKRLMWSRNPGVNKSNVYKCAKSKDKKVECNVIIPADLVESKFLEYMRKNVFHLEDIDSFWQVYNEEFDKMISKYTKIIVELGKRIEKHSNFISELSDIESRESDKFLKDAMRTQSIIAKELVDNYRKALKFADKKIKTIKKSKGELQQVVEGFLPGLFIEDRDENLIRIRREFILYFIDKVEVSYDKENEKVNFEKIVFLPPELI